MYAVIRIRGLKHLRPEVVHALKTLQLDRKNHCVLIHVNASTEGMLHQIKDIVAFGTLKTETIAKLLEKRGRLPGDKPITTEFLKAHKIASVDALAKELFDEKTTLKKLEIKPVFRLNSPTKGFGRIGIKQPVGLKGPLGFHENGIDTLLTKMM